MGTSKKIKQQPFAKGVKFDFKTELKTNINLNFNNMKTKNEILENKYVINSSRGEIVFNNDTPKKLAQELVYLIENQTRIILDYGDIKTNESWDEVYDISGKIGLSKGFYDLKYPILLHNERSTGGGVILTSCIIKISTSKGKKLIYQNELK